MKLLSIETSCDETAIAILEFEKEQVENIHFKVLSNHVLSQINLHREFGGVFPDLAKREHAKNIVKVFAECIKEAGLYVEKETILDLELIERVRTLLNREEEMFSEIIKFASRVEKPSIEAISVTSGPGLAPALWVGVNFAKALSIIWNIEVYPINHMEGHIVSSLVTPLDDKNYKLKNFTSPALALLISGGHTEIVSFKNLGKYKKIGKTLDDAVGEAFDKVARSLGLLYPGGPEISKIAELARLTKVELLKEFKLPRPMINSKDLNFSFSGLKTAVIYKIKEMKDSGVDMETIKIMISLDFENSVTEILLKKIRDALRETNSKSLFIGGGVIANKHIRKSFTLFCQSEDIDLYIPENFLTGDNAFMIGVAAMLQILEGKTSIYLSDIKANSNWSLENL